MPPRMSTKKAKKKAKRGQKKQSKNAKSIPIMCKTLWIDRIVRTNFMPKSVIENNFGTDINKNVNGILTAGESTTAPFYARMGSPLDGGSATLDMYCPLRLYCPFSVSETNGRLGLVSDKHSDPSHIYNYSTYLSGMEREEIDNMLGGSFFYTEVQNAAECKMIKSLLLSDCLHKDLPVFGTKQSTIRMYAHHQNSHWAMFYAEFYHLVNHVHSNCQSLRHTSMGYIWEFTLQGFGTLSTNNLVFNDAYLETVQAVMDMIVVIFENTHCLMNPVGSQHCFHESNDAIDHAMKKTLNIICSEDAWLGECCPYTGIQGRCKNRDIRTHRAQSIPRNAWLHVRTMIINLYYICRTALFVTRAFTNVLLGMDEKVEVFTEDIIREAQKEEPVMYGYKMKTGHLARALLNKTSPQAAYIPFDFEAFISSLAMKTGMPVSNYTPIIVALDIRLTEMTASKMDDNLIAYFIHSWVVGMGDEHKEWFSAIRDRMICESVKYAFEFKSTHDSALARMNHPVNSSILLRCGHNSKTGLLLEVSHRDCIRGSIENKDDMFAVWATHIFTLNPSYEILFGTVLNDDLPCTAWEPFSPPEPVKSSANIGYEETVKIFNTMMDDTASIISRQWRTVLFRRRVKQWTDAMTRSRAVIQRSARVWLWRTRERTRGDKAKRTRVVAVKFRRLAAAIKRRTDTKEFMRGITKVRRVVVTIQTLFRSRQARAVATLEKQRRAEMDEFVRHQEAQRMHSYSQTMHALQRQVEYFVVHNLINDSYLLSFVNPMTGNVPYSILATFPTVIQFTCMFQCPPEALLYQVSMASPILEAFPDGVKSIFN